MQKIQHAENALLQYENRQLEDALHENERKQFSINQNLEIWLNAIDSFIDKWKSYNGVKQQSECQLIFAEEPNERIIRNQEFISALAYFEKTLEENHSIKGVKKLNIYKNSN